MKYFCGRGAEEWRIRAEGRGTQTPTNLIYPRAEWRHRSTVFIFNFEHISHLVLVLLVLILSMYLIASFGIIYSLLERIYTNWNTHHIASSSKQDIFIINFNANCNATFFLSFLSFDKWDKFASLRIVTPLLDLIFSQYSHLKIRTFE